MRGRPFRRSADIFTSKSRFIVAPPEMGEREDGPLLRYHVDPMTRKLRAEECDPRSLQGLAPPR
jgi:hypothetical protein